jgi:hypothetical protein
MRKKSSLLIIFLLYIGTCSIFAQEYRNLWYNFGLGTGTIFKFQRSAFIGKLTYQKGHTTYSLRGLRLFRLFSEARYDKAWDIGFLYGRTLTHPSSRIQISGGIGIALTGVKVEYDDVDTIGIPIDGQISYRFSSSFGVGLYGYWNINGHQNFYGAGLIFQIGKNLNN